MIEKKQVTRADLIKINDYIFEISQEYRADMRVPVRIFANEAMINDVLADLATWQILNVATLPGIQKYAYAMPDIHQGYGFPIGGVAAMAIDEGGVISPGGIGYDINCGVRLLRSNTTFIECKKYIADIATAVFEAIPSGVGRGGRLTLKAEQLDMILKEGAPHMVQQGYGSSDDLQACENGGVMDNADPTLVSDYAKKRGADQIGTLGSGNHFLEIQYVDEIFDNHTANALGLEKDMITVMIHCGSRGLGHQVCTDYVRIMMNQMNSWSYTIPDRELVCAPFNEPVAQQYFRAMAAASNYAWANRHMIAHWTRKAWRSIMKEIRLDTVYDVSHNIGKIETHTVNNQQKQMIVHRKGATRAFGKGHAELSERYRPIGQPVLVPGTMGTASYVMIGIEESMHISFGSCCHGAGRIMSRAHAKRTIHGKTLRQNLEAQGIVIRTESNAGLAEEAPTAYKNIEDVVQVVHGAGLAKKVARLKPIAVIKGG